MSILEGDLAEAVTAALTDAGVPYSVTVTRTTPGEPDPSTPWIPGTPVVTEHEARGWVDAWVGDEIDGTSILRTDAKIIVLLTSLAIVPAVGDSITAGGQTYPVIVNVAIDPAGATATVQARS